MTAPLRVFIADDHPLVRDGLRSLLAARAGFEVIGEARTGEEAVELCDRLAPDVVIMDVHMPGIGGVEATRCIRERHPGTAVLMLTMFDDDASLLDAIRAGAKGYVLKGAERDDIARAVEGVGRGDAVFGPAVAPVLLDLATTRASSGTVFPELTEREREVLDLLAHGLDNATIARRLFVSRNTVRNHLSNIFAKLHVTDRAQAIVLARRSGLGGD